MYVAREVFMDVVSGTLILSRNKMGRLNFLDNLEFQESSLLFWLEKMLNKNEER